MGDEAQGSGSAERRVSGKPKELKGEEGSEVDSGDVTADEDPASIFPSYIIYLLERTSSPDLIDTNIVDHCDTDQERQRGCRGTRSASPMPARHGSPLTATA